MIETYDEFMGGILSQLYKNRENHTNSENRDVDFMFKIGAEQFGQLGKALADENMEKAEVEIFHTAAILFEIHLRLKGQTNNGNRNSDSTSIDDNGVQPGDSAEVLQGGEDSGVRSGTVETDHSGKH